MNVQGFLLRDEKGREYLVNLIPLQGSKLMSFVIQSRGQGVWKVLNKRAAFYASIQAKVMTALAKFSVQVGSGNIVISAHPSSEDPAQ